LGAQWFLGLTAHPLLVEATPSALVAAVEEATLVVVGVSPRWRRDGIGAVRRTLVREARPPVVLVHAGPRPGGLAPRDARTRFSWSLEL
jgi:nucleotide-binding universal stress UspA family protein